MSYSETKMKHSTSRTSRLPTFALLIFLVSPITTWSQTIDEFILQEMSQRHIPGLSACIVKKGTLLWTGNYGFANISQGIPVDSNTIFMLASVSKTVTATALMQLYEDNLFGLDDNIKNYLPFSVVNPFFPGTPITFRMLLAHTSSIQDNYAVLDTMYSFGMDHPMPLDTFLVNYLTPGGSLYDPNLSFYAYEPGTQWNYSNYGIALCGYLVESITGVPFDVYCEENIFKPLEMTNTAWFMRDLDTTLIARPYQYVGGQYVDYGLYGYPDYPDGQLRTTATSLAHFLQANLEKGFFNGAKMLDSSTVTLMRTAQFPLLDPTQGIVWYRITGGRGRILWGHNGGDLGASTEMFLSEEDSTGVIVLTNGEANVVAIRDRLFDAADTITTSVITHATDPHPATFVLKQNYPNPFNTSTVIRYVLSVSVQVSLKVFDVLGRDVLTLVDAVEVAGSHRVVLNAPNLSTGVYFYTLKAGSFTDTKRLLLLK